MSVTEGASLMLIDREQSVTGVLDFFSNYLLSKKLESSIPSKAEKGHIITSSLKQQKLKNTSFFKFCFNLIICESPPPPSNLFP
jgi:hypothetical protein